MVQLGHRGSSRGVPVSVLTWNLYLGGDITRPVRAAQGLTGPAALLALGNASRDLRDVVTRTDFATRSRLLAADIVAAGPDLVGLQEVALWRHGPLQLDHPGRLDATEVDDDFLALLLAELADRGAGYEVVGVQQESDVEAPAFRGNPLTGSAAGGEDIRFTDREVILMRTAAGLRVTGSGGGAYTARLDVTLGGLPFAFVRGYAWVDVTAGSTRFRFLTTHLESQSSDLARAQADELVRGPVAAATGPVIVVGDLNSDPADSAVRAGSTATGAAAYGLLTGRGGLSDAWRQAPHPNGAGNTGTYGELLDDPTAAGLDRRLDLVLSRGSRTVEVRAVSAAVTGDQPDDRDPVSGLWPSDHAGMVTRLEIG